MRNVIIMGAGGRDFHDFNVVYRNDADVEVVAFTGTDWPDFVNIRYPTSLAGSRYPNGIAVFPEEQLADLIVDHSVDEVVLAYAGLSHDDVMHRASVVLAAGANFTLLGPDTTMLRATTPVVAVCAARTGSGKSQASRRIGQILLDAGLRVALISHPLSYHGLEERPVQRFATGADIASSDLTIEEREAYERPVEMGMVVFAGVDYCAVITQAQAESDVIVWDGGNNDLPFVRPDLHVVVVDPARAGEEFRYHPGETNLRMADVILVNKMDTADSACVKRAFAQMTHVNPTAKIVLSTSHVMLEDGLALAGHRVLVVEDGPTVTHGGMPFGAGTVAAQNAGALRRVDPRPFAVGSLAKAFATFPHMGHILPAMGYSRAELDDLEATINAVDCDVVVSGTPIPLRTVIHSRHPIRQATYELVEVGEPTLGQILEPVVAKVRATISAVA